MKIAQVARRVVYWAALGVCAILFLATHIHDAYLCSLSPARPDATHIFRIDGGKATCFVTAAAFHSHELYLAALVGAVVVVALVAFVVSRTGDRTPGPKAS